MTTVAACPRCHSRNVMFIGESIAGTGSYHFHCYECGHDTPEHAEMCEADADVRWVTLTTPAPVPAARVEAYL